MVELRFYRLELVVVSFLVFWVFWSYGPASPARPTPVDGVLARFDGSISIAGRPTPFFFGLATAPAHVEDALDDAWLTFAREGKVAAWANTVQPERRNAFWTAPEPELDISAAANVQLFRLGVDWGRLVPTLPSAEAGSVVDPAALARYREILQMVHARNMTVMLTLFHHSMPAWAAGYGGWTRAQSVEHFGLFAAIVAEGLGDLVDYWVPFNEPTVFCGLTYCAGAWPPGFAAPSPAAQGLCMMAPAMLGNYSRAMAFVALAHRAAAREIRRHSAAPIGVAHNVAYMSPAGVADVAPAWLSDRLMVTPFIAAIASALDFVGLNYYGQEFMAGVGQIAVLGEEEYSDSGRAVYPDGLFHLLKAFHARFPTLPLVITENGVADDADVLRPPYLVEHLLAVAAARAAGVPVAGFVLWTVADNWEWADGFCPKFGLAAVERGGGALRHVLRNTSYELFRTIARSKVVTEAQAAAAWAPLAAAAATGTQRSFCRALEGTGLTGFGGLDVPVQRPLVSKDWRFGLWKAPPYTDPLSRALLAARRAALGALASALGMTPEEVTARWEAAKAAAASPEARERAAATRQRLSTDPPRPPRPTPAPVGGGEHKDL